MTTYYELSPAYGRNPKTAKEALSDWKEGKDWQGDYQMGFKVCSIRDVAKGCVVELRYANLRKVVVVRV